MKCARSGCEQEANRSNGKYCSREHSPYGSLADYDSSTVKTPKPKKKGIYAAFGMKRKWAGERAVQDCEAKLLFHADIDKAALAELLNDSEIKRFLKE